MTRLIFNSSEQEIADLLGMQVDTVRSWRQNGTLPDYLYRRFGNSSQFRIKYCELLVLRWQACADEGELKSEEMWARAELIKSLTVGKK
jgi:phage terminase Nu1 subunit (DNA packaging protein)